MVRTVLFPPCSTAARDDVKLHGRRMAGFWQGQCISLCNDGAKCALDKFVDSIEDLILTFKVTSVNVLYMYTKIDVIVAVNISPSQNTQKCNAGWGFALDPTGELTALSQTPYWIWL